MPQEYIDVVNECKYKLFNTPAYGILIPIGFFTYNNIYNEMKLIKDSNPDRKWGHTFIDHADALEIDNNSTSGVFLKDDRSAVKYMFRQLIKAKKQLCMPSFVTAHTSAEAEKQVQKGNDTGTRNGATSSATTKDVDISISAEATPELKLLGLVKFTLKKLRTTSDVGVIPFIIKKEFTACRFVYKAELQEMLGIKKGKELDTSSLDLIDSSAEDLIG